MTSHVSMCKMFSYMYSTWLLQQWSCTHKTMLAKFINAHTHTSGTQFLIFDPWSSVSLSWVHVTVFMACITGSWMHWMLSTVNYTPLGFSLIYPEGPFMYSSVRSVQLSSKIYCDDCARNLYIFPLSSSRHRVIFLCCVLVHMYLCTECVYWYETHSYCYLCIAKFI